MRDWSKCDVLIRTDQTRCECSLIALLIGSKRNRSTHFCCVFCADFGWDLNLLN